jgi:hypothetical protein
MRSDAEIISDLTAQLETARKIVESHQRGWGIQNLKLCGNRGMASYCDLENEIEALRRTLWVIVTACEEQGGCNGIIKVAREALDGKAAL